eukprot:c54042_g1_i1 orf=2-199(+)
MVLCLIFIQYTTNYFIQRGSRKRTSGHLTSTSAHARLVHWGSAEPEEEEEATWRLAPSIKASLRK